MLGRMTVDGEDRRTDGREFWVTDEDGPRTEGVEGISRFGRENIYLRTCADMYGVCRLHITP